MDAPLLEISEVTVRREGRTLLDRVSLSLAAGSLHALVGPNGAGKSTLLSAILGLGEFDGTIRWHFRGGGRIGYVPQRFTVDRTLPLTVGEFLALSRQRRPVCLGLSAKSRVRAIELLARVGLPDLTARPLRVLSGGELQRVLLANALDPIPEALLLDEPSTGLDAAALALFEEILTSVRSHSGVAVLMVAHDLAQVRRLADQVTLLSVTVKGSGAPAQVLSEGFAP